MAVPEVPARPFFALKQREHLLPIIAFGAALAATLLYVSYAGLIVYMGDSFLLANRAKHLADQFNLNLNNGLSPLIYPPLYPILIAFVYRFQDPHLIFRLILLVNALVTASQVFPLHLLLEEYSNLSRKNAVWLATAIALAPASLPYSTMVMTDVLYCPVVLWLSLFMNRAMQRRRAKDFLATGLTLAAAMLTRSAASVALVASGIALGAYFWQHRASWTEFLKTGIAAGAGGFFALYGCWIVFERFFVKYEGFMPQFVVSSIPAIFLNAQRFDLHFSWFTNLLFYYLTAPLSLAGAFVFVLFAWRPAILRRDAMAVFFLTCMLIGAAVASFVTDDHWGGRELTWNRYVMPYVVFAVLMAIRYRSFARPFIFSACTAVMAVAVLSSRPAYLGCHFTDALALFGKVRPFQSSDAFTNLLYFALVFAGGWLWLHKSKTSQRIALMLTGCLWLATDVASARYYRNSGDLNITAYNGIAERAYQASRMFPGSQLYYDPEFTRSDPFPGLRVLFFWPNLDIRPLASYQFAQIDPPSNAHVLYFTTLKLDSATPVAEERGHMKLYDVTGSQLRQSRSQSQGTRLGLDIRDDFPQAEIGERDHRRYQVRWLPRITEFEGTLGGETVNATVSLELATNGPPRTAKLIVNGKPALETYRVEGNFWNTASTTARFRVTLNHGPNSFRLTSVEPAGRLSDGREVAFLMIGDVQVVSTESTK